MSPFDATPPFPPSPLLKYINLWTSPQIYLKAIQNHLRASLIPWTAVVCETNVWTFRRLFRRSG